jgi:N-acetylmuramate 1-kinase
MPQRLSMLTTWLEQQLKTDALILAPMAGDASFRRYFRVQHEGRSLIAADAPPATEDTRSFVTLADVFSKAGVIVPEIFASDIENGFLLLSDFGENVYLNALHAKSASGLYENALHTLQKIQKTQATLPAFDRNFILQELQFFQEWFLEKYLQVDFPKKLLHETFEKLVQSATEQPQVLVHRDYHSRNLMVLPGSSVGVLDFQDAVWGPVTYDIVSLLRDCYIDWPETDVKRWALAYYHESTVLSAYSPDQFLRWFDLMGIQRHLKAAFIFARKHLRDGVSTYLSDIPRTITYVLNITREYPEFREFHKCLADTVAPRIFR